MFIGLGEYLTIIIAAFYACFRLLPFDGAVICVLSITSAILWRLYVVNFFWVRRGVPGPKPNLLFGNLLQMTDGFKTFDIKNTKIYGKNFGTVIGGNPTFSTSDLDLLRQILVKQFDCFVNREIRNITYNENNIQSKMMLVLKDQLWKDVRRTATPAFSSAKMKNMMPLMEECCRDLIEAFDNVIVQKNGEFEAKDICGNYTMDTIAKCAFGMNAGCQRGDSLFAEYARKLLGFTFWNPGIFFITLFPNVARRIEILTGHKISHDLETTYIVDAIQKVIKERRCNPNVIRHDFLQLLLDCSEQKNDEGEVDRAITNDVISKGGHKIELSDELIVSQCFIFLVAGYETSSSTIQFCVYNLATNPQVQQKGYEEVKRVMGDKEVIEYDDLTNMPYVDQIIKETLRIFPPIPSIGRSCNRDVTIDGIKFESGCQIHGSTFAIHFNEELYENPEQFRPERFSPEERKTTDPLAFVPFGFGPRNCIGMRFAQLEMRLAIAYMLKNFKFVVNDKTPESPLKINALPFTKPAVPIYLTAIRRSK